ncbi:MAG: hypothetical protein PHE49_10565 [bacterium]|nr:hypothetical protein [bacterium]
MNQEEKDIFVISLVGLILASIPTILYIVNGIGKEAFVIFNHIGNVIFMMGLGQNIGILIRSTWLQHNLKLKIILTVLYSNILLVLGDISFYLSLAQYGNHNTKYPHMKSFFITDLWLSIALSAFVILSILKKHKKLNTPLKK